MRWKRLLADDETLGAHCERMANVAGVAIDSDEGVAMQSAEIKRVTLAALEAF